MDRTIPLELPFNDTEITGDLCIIGGRGVVVPRFIPIQLAHSEGREALLAAVLDGRIKLPADVHTLLDLSGAEPRVK